MNERIVVAAQALSAEALVDLLIHEASAGNEYDNRRAIAQVRKEVLRRLLKGKR